MTIRTFRGMPHRRLGRSGLWVSEVGLGLWKWGDPAYDGSRIGEHEGFAVLDRALSLGITHWDTANSYNLGSGNSERLLGRYFAARGPSARDDVVLATKIRNAVREEHAEPAEFGPNRSGASRAYIFRAVEDSLRRLQTDRIDVLYHHAPCLTADGDWEAPLDETWDAFNRLVEQGKVLYLAASNRTARQLREETAALASVAANPARRIVAVQNRYNLLERARVSHGAESEGAFLKLLRDLGMGLVPMVPLAVGLLTGRYRRDRIDPNGRLSEQAGEGWRDEFLTDRNFELIDRIEALAAQQGCTMSQLAIAWLLAHDEVSSVIAGVTRMEQLEDNAGAAAVRLKPDVLEALNGLTQP